MQTKIEKCEFKGLSFYLLRDDLLNSDDANLRHFNGNKARKLHYYLNADLKGVCEIISHGGSQSNAMFALSEFAKFKNLKFKYVISHLSGFLREFPDGNFARALANGMEIFVSENRREFALSLMSENSLFIDEGVANSHAANGFKIQAAEIQKIARNLGVKFDIFLPSGTGVSAGNLAKFSEFRVFTCPCVGDARYLKTQLDAQNLGNLANLKILNPPKKFHFAKPAKDLIKIWQELRNETKIEFDLIYDPVGFLTLFSNLREFENPLLYIHQGGVLANSTQLARYERKFI